MTNIGLIMSIIRIQGLKLLSFVPKSTLIPHILLEVEIPGRKYKVSALDFTHFLCFMCRYYCNDTRQCLTSLRNLQQSIWEESFSLNREDMDTSYSCLGIVLHLLGDYNGAREAFQLARYGDTVSFRGRLNLHTKNKT